MYLPGHIKVTRFQDYLNWLLEDVKGNNIFEITPKIDKIQNLKLKDIKRFDIQDSSLTPHNSQDEIESKTINLPLYLINKLFNDVDSYNKIINKKLVKAKLSLFFKKPKAMKEEEYQNIMSAMLKSFDNEDDITALTKNKEKIKGSHFSRSKQVSLEIIKNNLISESSLQDEMKKFLFEL
jgi:hypothetical protein